MASLDETAMEYLRYFLGPTGIPDRLAAASQVVDAVSPVSGTMRSMEAAGEGRYLDSALEGAAVAAPAGISALLARGSKAAAPYVAGAVDEGEAALRAMFGMPEGAVIRPDDVFRGEGPVVTSIAQATKPYAVRVTGQSQIDDMVKSGLVRPPEGGYGGKPVVYFHEMNEATPTSVFHTPKSDPGKGFSIVMDSAKAAGREGPISLDELKHIWTLRDGEMVDVLGEIRRMNREYDVQKFADGGPVSSAPNRMTAYRNARAAEGPQRGLTYSELLLDNILGLDNEYLSAGERLGQQFNADELGFLKNAAVGAYEGAKRVVSDPIGAGEDLLSGIYDSVSNLATEDLDARLKRMYGVGVDQASDEQVNRARESVFGDALTASQLIPGAALVGKGVGAMAGARAANTTALRNLQQSLADLEARMPVPEPEQLEPEADYWEGVEPLAPEAEFLDVEDIDWDEDVVEQMNNAMLRREGSLPPENKFEVRPAIGQREGVAGLYSPTRRAVDLLDRPAYDNLDSLRVQLLNRGAKPDELERVISRARDEMDEGPLSKERLASLSDSAAGDVVVSTRDQFNSPRDNLMFLTDDYFLKGAEDIGANVFEFATDADRTPNVAFNHFIPSSQSTAPLLHTRFGMVYSRDQSDAPDTYHLGEIQSDWAQTRAKLPTDPGARETLMEEALGLDSAINEASNSIISRERELGLFPDVSDYSDPRFDDPELEARRKVLEQLVERHNKLGDQLSLINQYGTRGDFDANYPAPYVGTTSKWVQLALRQSLLDAVNRGAQQMSLSTGKMVRGYTRGQEKGQTKFYDDIVPKELDAVLKKFAKEAGIKKPEIEMDTIGTRDGSSYTVPVVRFTDEFKEAIKRIGLPAFAKGGIVPGSYLDLDLDLLDLPSR